MLLGIFQNKMSGLKFTSAFLSPLDKRRITTKLVLDILLKVAFFKNQQDYNYMYAFAKVKHLKNYRSIIV